jgi:glycosyltransferase involved in cell wall biosynthesis
VSSGGSLYRKLIAAVLTRLFRVRYVVHVHSGGFEQWVTGSPIHRWTARRLFSNAAAVLVLADRWRGMAARLGSRRTVVVHNSLREARWRELAAVGEARRETRQRAGSRVLLYYGRWSSTKGTDVLARAVQRLIEDCSAPFELRIFGNGDRDWLEREFDGVNGTMRMGGWLEDHRKASELGEADVFVYPSRVEGFGQTLLEVMAAEVPIVATDVGAIPEVLAGYPQARLVAPENPDALADALRDVVEDRWPPPSSPGTTDAMERFTTERVLTALVRTYDEVASEAR